MENIQPQSDHNNNQPNDGLIAEELIKFFDEQLINHVSRQAQITFPSIEPWTDPEMVTYCQEALDVHRAPSRWDGDAASKYLEEVYQHKVLPRVISRAAGVMTLRFLQWYGESMPEHSNHPAIVGINEIKTDGQWSGETKIFFELIKARLNQTA